MTCVSLLSVTTIDGKISPILTGISRLLTILPFLIFFCKFIRKAKKKKNNKK